MILSNDRHTYYLPTVTTAAPVKGATALMKDKGYLESVMKQGAERAGYVARHTLSKVYRKIGFVQPK